MASSQVEIASSSPFGYVLRDRNQRDRVHSTSDSNPFPKKFKDLIQNHLNKSLSGHPRISVSGSSHESSSCHIDFTDLWVHKSQGTKNEKNQHSFQPGYSNSNENSQQNVDFTDLWVHNPQRNNNQSHPMKGNSGRKWDRAREMVFEVERNSLDGVSSGPVSNSQGGRNQDDESSGPVFPSHWGKRTQDCATSGSVSASRRIRTADGPSSLHVSDSQKGRSQAGVSSEPIPISQRAKFQDGTSLGPILTSRGPLRSQGSVEFPCMGGVSSLVQKWRDFSEANSCSSNNSPVCRSRTDSALLFAENTSAEAPASGFDAWDESIDLRPMTPVTNEESFADSESDRTGLSGPPSSDGRNSDPMESERIRVADIIRKLTSNVEENNDREPCVGQESLSRLRTSLDQSEQKSFSPVSSSHWIRGRQALTDLLMRMECERKRELEGLVEYKAVSKFSYRGRIQAMLRIKLQRRAEVKDDWNSKRTSTESNKMTQSTIMHLRERFSLGVQDCASDLRSQEGERADSNKEVENFITSHQQRRHKHHQALKTPTAADSDNKANAECSLSLKPVNGGINHYESKTALHQSALQVKTSKRKENNLQELTQTIISPQAMSESNADADSSFRLNSVEEEISHCISNIAVQHRAVQVQKSEGLHQEASSSANHIQQGTISKSHNHDKSEFTVTETSFNLEGKMCTEFQEANRRQLTRNGNELIDEITCAQGDWEEEEANNQLATATAYGCISDVSHPLSGWEELRSDYLQQEESNLDWKSNVSRPRSTWENLRQARYQEMSDPFLENDEIQKLIERKSVSNFLSSGQGKKIERLMMIRTQPPNPLGRQIMAEKQPDEVKEGENKEDGLRETGQEQEGARDEEHEEEEEEEIVDENNNYEESEVDENQTGRQCIAVKDYVHQTTSWVYNQDHEVSDYCSDQVASPSIGQSLSLNSYYQETRPSSSFSNHPSIEMELINEMRENMVLLHQEISELRRSLKSCMNLQMELPKSIKEEVRAALGHSGRKKRRDSPLNKKSNRGRCCVCYEMQIDSLLYRCGHMCTCFNCANDLQLGRGKCPICHAPIIDVVRAYPHS